MTTGRITLADLRAAVRDNLDELEAAFWSDARLNRCLTRAADFVLNEVRKVRNDYLTNSLATTSGTVTIYGNPFDCTYMGITAGQGVIFLPPDFLEFRLVESIEPDYEWVRIVLASSLSDPNVRAARLLSNQPGIAQDPNVFYLSPFGPTATNAVQYAVSPLSTIDIDLSVIYVSSAAIVTTLGERIRAFTTDTDELILPHPLYMAVEEVATWRAQMQDRDPMAAAWVSVAQASVARFMGASTRQSMDPEYVQGTFE